MDGNGFFFFLARRPSISSTLGPRAPTTNNNNGGKKCSHPMKNLHFLCVACVEMLCSSDHRAANLPGP